MLHLLGTPQWRTADRSYPLPNTLPGWTVAFLAVVGDWVPRERLTTLLWPDAAPAEAQHSLRMNLYRVRQLMSAWDAEAALGAERRRVRLVLPTDLATLRQALSDQGAALSHRPVTLLASITFEGFPALREWADLERAVLASAWREALLARVREAAPTEALELALGLLGADPLDDAAATQALQTLHALGRHGDALRVYEQFRERLQRELGIEPPPALRSLAGGPSAAAGAPADAHAFVGRRIELAELARRLAAAPRLHTLVGPGGVGKSRLARQALAQVPRPTTWIDLQDLTTLDAVLGRLAQRLGFEWHEGRGELAQAMARAMGSQPRLVVLDNAEHLAREIAAFAEGWLAAAPGLTLLVTSREPLGASGESVLTLEGLAVPDEASRDIEAAAAFDAIRLFDLRAAAASPGFRLEHHLDAVLEIVERTGGLPLAIELAASWLRLLPPQAIADEMRKDLGALERDPAAAGLPARAEHARLAAVLDRSWALLAPAERDALERLSVFEGPFAAADARTAAGVAMPLLASLADKGLLRTDQDTGRFSLHAVLASHARARIEREPLSWSALRKAHAAYFASQLASTVREQSGDHTTLMRSIEQAGSDLRQAWAQAIELGLADAVLDACDGWRRWFVGSGRYAQGERHFEQALALAGPTRTARLARARARAALAWLAKNREDAERAIVVAHQVLVEAQALDDAALHVDAANTLGAAELLCGRWSEATGWFERALRLAEDHQLRREIASAHNNLGLVGLCEGRFEGCAAHFERAVALQREIGDLVSLARTLHNQASVHMAEGRWRDARDANEQALRYALANGAASIATITAFMQGATLIELGQPEAAERHLNQAIGMCRAQDDAVFDFKCRYYLMRIQARAGPAVPSADTLLHAAREAQSRGAHYDLLYVAAFVAEQWQRAGHAAAAASLLRSVADAPQADAFVRATLVGIGRGADSAPPFQRSVEALLCALDLDDARRRFEAMTLR